MRKSPGVSYKQGRALNVSLEKGIEGVLNERGLLDERLQYIFSFTHGCACRSKVHADVYFDVNLDVHVPVDVMYMEMYLWV